LLLICVISERKDDSSELEEAQKNQKKAGAAQSDPQTSGRAENLREEAAEIVDEDKTRKSRFNFFLNHFFIGHNTNK